MKVTITVADGNAAKFDDVFHVINRAMNAKYKGHEITEPDAFTMVVDMTRAKKKGKW